MADRIYDRVLKCGCMYSSDGGGGLLPCLYGYEDDTEETKRLQALCEEAHREWKSSKDYEDFERECIENNQ